MSDSCKLLTSNEGLLLGPEICLKVTEFLIDLEPTAVGALLRCSKSFNYLLKTYERSITKTVSTLNRSLTYVNIDQAQVLSSVIPSSHTTVTAFSFQWFSEMRCRAATVEFLISHEITDLEDEGNWPTLDVSKVELTRRLQQFKRNALGLIYCLADCAVGVDAIEDIRAQQSAFLDGLSGTELANLGCIVEAIGQGFFNITKRALLDSELGRSLGGGQSSVPRSNLYTPTSLLADDLMNDNWIRECMCVFEDRVQRYGPSFAWAYVEGSSNAHRRLDIWARNELQKGLDDMNAFELGYTMSFASLQSVVWRVFCRKVNCTLQDSWATAKSIVESEIAAYVFKE